MPDRVFQTGQGRAYLQMGGASPANELEYQGLARMGAFSLSEGEPTKVQAPSSSAYDQFDDIDEVAGETSRPTTSMIARFGLTNPILSAKCPFHIQAHWGKCSSPNDANGGWEKILAYEHARFTNRSGDEQTAIDEAGRATILLTGDISARKMWEIDNMSLGEVASDDVTREVVAVVIQDYVSCGDCGYTSNGENRIYAVTKSSGSGSPGMPAELLVSVDGGSTWTAYDVDTLAADEQPSGLAVIGTYIVVISNDSASMHLAPVSDPDSWTEVTTGFVAGAAPTAIYSAGSTRTWIVGDNGYVYFTASPTDGVTVQSTGGATTENLVAVHGSDSLNVVGVGENGAVIFTANGGRTWYATTVSPTVSNILCVWMRTPYQIVVGTNAGRIYYTIDGGAAWNEKVFPLSGQGEVKAFSFADHTDSPFGFMTATNGSKGFIFRTLDGGASWYQLPDTSGATPDNDALNSLSAGPSGNFVVAGGLGADALDGIVLVAS